MHNYRKIVTIAAFLESETKDINFLLNRVTVLEGHVLSLREVYIYIYGMYIYIYIYIYTHTHTGKRLVIRKGQHDLIGTRKK